MWLRDYVWHGLLKHPFKINKVIDSGGGDNVVVLIHGLASKSQIWQPLIEILDKTKYRVICYDLLGFGTSPKPNAAKYTTSEHARSIIYALKKDLPANQKIILIGHSMGCIIASHIAYSSHTLVKHLVLYQPPILLDNTRKTTFHKKMYEYVASKPPLVLGYIRLVNKFSRSRLESYEQAIENWGSIEKSIKNTILAQATIFELKNLSIQTDIVYGRVDFMVSKLDAKRMAKINHNIRLHSITETHDINKRSAKYLQKLIEGL